MTRALVVDDRAENRYLLRAFLQAHGWVVDEAGDGAQALASARAAVPDVVVSDLLMPVMDGYTLLRQWEADERLRGVPFVVYTATYTDPDDERLARDLGAAAFVLKPQEPEDLLRLLDDVIGRGGRVPSRLDPPPPADEDRMRQYSEVLVRKLEEKTAQLERANRQLETDMAARRQAEALAESARAQLSQAFERVTDAFVALDRDWRYTYVNARAGELFGRDPAQLLGKHIWTEFPEGVGQPFHLAYERAMAQQKPLHFEGYYGPFDRWFENIVYPSPNGLSIYFHDITVRKEAEAALRQSEERLRLALDAAHMGTYDWDMPTGRLIWSRRHEALWGYAEGEFDGTYESFGARIHPQDLAAMNAEVSRCMVAREPFTHEFRVVWPDGSVHWIEGWGEFEFDTAGTAVRMRGVVTEVTPRKQAQERDREQLAELRRWHELTVGREERVAELKGTVDRLLAARGLPPRFGAVAAADPPVATVEPLAADSGRSRLALLNLLDDQRRAVEALRRSEAGLRLAQARASIGSWELDLARTSVACSDEMRRLFRCAQATGPVPLAELAHALLPADRSALAPGGVWSLQEPRAARQQLRVRDPDGTITWIDCKGETEFGQDGLPVRVSGTAQDVTERQHLLERLAESNEQLRALAARMDRLREEESSRLSRELHDELGQALAGLKLDLATLHARLAADQPAAAARISGMQAQIDGLVRTTRDIARRLRPRVLDDLGLLPALEAQAGEICRRMGARYELVSDVPNEALADPALATAVYRVVQEALTNIARHAAATRVDIAVLGQRGWLTVEVRDNGRGIAPPTQPGRATLGLLGMQERAAAIGGQVTVEGFPGQGTVVTLRVPLGTRTEAA